jgi:hypothetical protein
MAAKDVYHDQVRSALVKDGWTITHDPYTLAIGHKAVFVDLGAEQMLAAEKQSRKIAVEVKSFQSPSDMHDFEVAMGQYVFYRSLMARIEPDRKLYLAVPHSVLLTTFDEAIAKPVLEDVGVAMLSFDPKEGRIMKWIG